MRTFLLSGLLLASLGCLALGCGGGRGTTYEVSGNVLGSDGKAVTGVRIKMKLSDGDSRSAEVVDGKFKVLDVPKGKVQIAFEKVNVPGMPEMDEKMKAAMKKAGSNLPPEMLPGGKNKAFSNNVSLKYFAFDTANLEKEVVSNQENVFDLKLTN